MTRISTLNKALLCEWNWCFVNEKGGTLESSYQWKHGEGGGGVLGRL